VDKMIDLLRRMSENGGMTVIGHQNGVPEHVKKRDIDAFLAALDASRERKQEAAYG
jgi:hypothetical protein